MWFFVLWTLLFSEVSNTSFLPFRAVFGTFWTLLIYVCIFCITIIIITSNVLMPFQLFFGCLWQFLAIDNSFFILQHHCRKCGSVVCASCSSQKFLMPAQSSKPLRVCDPCYAILSKTETTALPSSTVEGKQNLKSSKYFAVLILRNVLKPNYFKKQCSLPEVDIQVQNDHWGLNRLVSRLKCTVLAWPVPHCHFGLVYYLR